MPLPVPRNTQSACRSQSRNTDTGADFSFPRLSGADQEERDTEKARRNLDEEESMVSHYEDIYKEFTAEQNQRPVVTTQQVHAQPHLRGGRGTPEPEEVARQRADTLATLTFDSRESRHQRRRECEEHARLRIPVLKLTTTIISKKRLKRAGLGKKQTEVLHLNVYRRISRSLRIC
jgi:hypothetical protein